MGEIETYQAIIDNTTTLPLDGLKVLLANVSAYIQEEGVDESIIVPQAASDHFDFCADVDDDDLLLAEPAALQIESLGTKRASPSGLGNAPSSKRSKPADDGTAVILAESILQKTCGFPRFRLKQEQSIARLINGDSAAVVFPTGGGKSLVYQIPALAFDDYDKYYGRKPGGGITLVVSPLIALTKVSQLGCSATSLR